MNKNTPISSIPSSEKEFGLYLQVKSFLLIAITLVGVYFCGELLRPFVPVLVWATALAVLFNPLQLLLGRKLKYPNVAALISVISIGLVVLILATFLGQGLLLQAAKGAVLIDSKVTSGEWQKSLENNPYLGKFIIGIEEEINLSDAVRSFGAWLTTTAGSIVKGSVYQVIGFFLTFYLLFFFLRDGSAALKTTRSLSPLSLKETNHIFDRIKDTIYATIYGTILVSLIQGLLGGVMFWWLGISASLFWGVIMAILAVVPVLGAFIIWIPAAVFLAMEGNWTSALILTLWGIFVVGTIDNLLRPILVGNRLKLHTVLVFISVVGGLILFGAVGLILGPVSLTITIELLKITSDRISINKLDFVDPTEESQ